MGDSAKRQATYEDLLRVPEHLVAEIIDGQLVTQRRPASPHALAVSVLGADLGAPFHRGKGGPCGWVLLDEPELRLHGNVLVPDLAGWRRERMPQIPDTAAFELARPIGFAKSSRRPPQRPIGRPKCPSTRERVGHSWLVDPATRTLEVYRLEAERWLLCGAWRHDAKLHAEPFEAVELELGGLWAR